MVTYLTLQPGDTIPYLHISTFHVRIKIILAEDRTFQKIHLLEHTSVKFLNYPPFTGTRTTMELSIKYPEEYHSHIRLPKRFNSPLNKILSTWDLKRWYEFRHEFLNYWSHHQWNLWQKITPTNTSSNTTQITRTFNTSLWPTDIILQYVQSTPISERWVWCIFIGSQTG